MKNNASVLSFFSGIKDHRLDRKKEHHLIDIIAIAISSVICGAENWNEVEMYGKVRESWHRAFLELPNGIPSHDTFNRFFAQLDPLAFETCFKQWVASYWSGFAIPSSELWISNPFILHLTNGF